MTTTTDWRREEEPSNTRICECCGRLVLNPGAVRKHGSSLICASCFHIWCGGPHAPAPSPSPP